MKTPKLKISKGATVQVIAGDDKGKRGSVLEIDPVNMKLVVQGVKMATHFDRQDGMTKREAAIDYSNVKLIEAAKPKKAAKAKKKS